MVRILHSAEDYLHVLLKRGSSDNQKISYSIYLIRISAGNVSILPNDIRISNTVLALLGKFLSRFQLRLSPWCRHPRPTGITVAGGKLDAPWLEKPSVNHQNQVFQWSQVTGVGNHPWNGLMSPHFLITKIFSQFHDHSCETAGEAESCVMFHSIPLTDWACW